MIIDLCCGIGRFENDDVISIDFDVKNKPTICADVRYLPLRPGLKPEHVHASPPCTYFSKARNFHYKDIDCQGIAESMKIVAACFHAFDYLEAKHWTLENPLGYLAKLLNEARIEHKAKDYQHKKTCFYSNKKGLQRAIIPQDIRQRLLK